MFMSTTPQPSAPLIGRRRLLALAGGQIAALTLLAACGGSASTTAGSTSAAVSVAATTAATTAAATTKAVTASAAPASSAVAVAGKGITVNYWDAFSGTNGNAVQELVKRFNAGQSDVTVNYQFQGTYEQTAQKIATALAAHQAPDVAILSDVWWIKYYLDDAITALDPFLKQNAIDPAGYVESFYTEGIKNGKSYWLPFARSTPLFYYNADLFSQAGVPPIQKWDDLITVAPKLMGQGAGGAPRFAFANANGNSYIAWVFQPLNWAFGGEYSDADFKMHFTDPETMAAAQYFSDLVNKEKIANNPTDIVAAFTNGLTATALMSTASLAGVEKTVNDKFKVATSFLPTEKVFGCCTGGAGLTLLKSSPAATQQAAFKWMAFATNEDSTIYWSQNTGYLPVQKSALNSAKMADFYKAHPNFKTAVDQLPKTRGQDLARVAIPNGDQTIGDALEALVIKNQPVQSVFSGLQQTMTAKAAPIIKQLDTRAKGN
ncbi:MAG: ABC transporter substrate-binding protein [Chloroflexota bacterium]